MFSCDLSYSNCNRNPSKVALLWSWLMMSQVRLHSWVLRLVWVSYKMLVYIFLGAIQFISTTHEWSVNSMPFMQFAHKIKMHAKCHWCCICLQQGITYFAVKSQDSKQQHAELHQPPFNVLSNQCIDWQFIQSSPSCIAEQIWSRPCYEGKSKSLMHSFFKNVAFQCIHLHSSAWIVSSGSKKWTFAMSIWAIKVRCTHARPSTTAGWSLGPFGWYPATTWCLKRKQGLSYCWKQTGRRTMKKYVEHFIMDEETVCTINEEDIEIMVVLALKITICQKPHYLS